MNLPLTMQTMVLEAIGNPLVNKMMPLPVPSPLQVLVKIKACGVCRTDLHIVDGELENIKLPLIPGHEIVGSVVKKGSLVKGLKEGDIVGIPWLGYTCGKCDYCLSGKENLCTLAGFTGYTIDGGFTEYTVADYRYCFSLPSLFANASGAPLLCAGLIGFRSYQMVAAAKKIGIYGFGAAAHILIQIAVAQRKQIFAFTRKADTNAQQFALKLNAKWAGNSSQPSPVPLDAAIIFAPAGELIPKALQDVDKGGMVVCGGIHMSDIPSFPYRLLWGERMIRSVANLTRNDGIQFFEQIKDIPIHTETHLYPLSQANEALEDLRQGNLQGAAVLTME